MRTHTPTNFAAAPLTEAERAAALEFLDRRPVHNVVMSGWMMERGVVSPQHRGTFYRTLDADGKISGIALIGRVTFFEAASRREIRCFAREAKRHTDVRIVFGEPGELADFGRSYGFAEERSDRRPQLLFERSDVPAAWHPEYDLRPARVSELDQVVAAHARMVLDETGTDPLAADADDFRARCRRRIDEGKTLVWVDGNGEVVFKTEIASRTPKLIYIEGVWVNPKMRGRGIARKCLENLCHLLLDGSNEICGFVDGDDTTSISLYLRAGFSVEREYSKVYVGA